LLTVQGDDLASCLQRRRRELGLAQPDAGKAIGVCKTSIWNWEHGCAQPEDWLYPSIIEFLGREPWPEPETLGEHLRAERRRRGMTLSAAAGLMGVAHSSLSNWEKGSSLPSKSLRIRVTAFLAKAI
jgi:DNA-binding XRE family transcriptional regulator